MCISLSSYLLRIFLNQGIKLQSHNKLPATICECMYALAFYSAPMAKKNNCCIQHFRCSVTSAANSPQLVVYLLGAARASLQSYFRGQCVQF